MTHTPTVFLMPDASVLVSLANSDKLDLLFEPGWTLVLIDSVIHDIVRTTGPCAEMLGKWLRKNNLPVVQTRVHDRAQQAIRQGLSIPQQMRMQDLGIQEVMNELALDCGDRVGVFLFEEHRIMSASFLEPQNCKKFSLKAFQIFLQQKAQAVEASRTLEAQEAAKQLTVEQPVAEQPVAEPILEKQPTVIAPKRAAIAHKPASKPAAQSSLGGITGAAIQLLGRKRAEAVEAFSKLKQSALKLTDSSANRKKPQPKKPATPLTPIARQKSMEQPQGEDEQKQVAPPKPMPKFKPLDTTQPAVLNSELKIDAPQSLTLQKLFETPEPLSSTPEAQHQLLADLQAAQVTAAQEQQSIVAVEPLVEALPEPLLEEFKHDVLELKPQQANEVVQQSLSKPDVAKKPLARQKNSSASKSVAAKSPIQKTLLNEDDKQGNAQEKAKPKTGVSKVAASKKPQIRPKKTANQKKQVMPAKVDTKPPTFILKKEETPASELTVPEMPRVEVQAQEAEVHKPTEVDNTHPAADPKLVSDFKNLIA